MKKFLCILIGFVGISLSLYAQTENSSINIDFRNQNITDVLYAISDMCSESIYIDETVTGRISFHFEDSSFESALKRFSEFAGLYVEKKDNVYFISKANIQINNSLISIEAEDVPVEPFLILLSRKSKTTIMYEKLPETKLTIRCSNVKLDEVLNLVLVKLNGYALEKIGTGYYISKNASANAKIKIDSYTLSRNRDGNETLSYTLKLQKANFINVLDELFKKENKEYSVINAKPVTIENLYYDSKDFSTMLALILEAASCDYSVKNGIYYIFEIQKNDVLKKFKDIKIIKLENINGENLLSLIPGELNNNAQIKIDKSSNSIILTGSQEQLTPIEDFIKAVDVPLDGRYYQKFSLKHLSVKDALASMPKNMFLSDVVVVPESTSFVTQVTEQKEKEIREYLYLIDNKQSSFPTKLKYIKSEDLIKYLPPSINKENICETGDSSLIFFIGTDDLYEKFLKDLELIDKPKQQIRYQILVLQHQKTAGDKFSSGIDNISNQTAGLADGITHSSSLYNLLDVKFDVVSKFGLKFASRLSAEISQGVSHVLADTTLNGISGESISFSNINVYRYRDVVKDSNGVYTSTAREISSGLTLSINGWVSGDEMITVNVNASVSKQGSSDSSSGSSSATSDSIPPSTSEKKVTTNVRTKSGEPVIIGGLLQEEKDVSEKKVPVLGYIPLLGLLFSSKTESVAETEMIIYLVPFVEKTGDTKLDFNKNIEKYYRKYVNKNSEEQSVR